VFSGDVFLSKLNVILALLSYCFLSLIFKSNECCRIYLVYPISNSKYFSVLSCGVFNKEILNFFFVENILLIFSVVHHLSY
jgi:hypothetical protein